MADYTNSIAQTTPTYQKPSTMKRNPKSSLDMDDFLQLMVAQMRNQDMMNPMDNSAMMEQLTQMTTVEAMNSMIQTNQITYATSFMGKEVTVAAVSATNKVEEVTGTVTGIGLFSGDPIIYVDNKPYSLSQIMSVGKLPEEEKPKPDETPE